MLSYRMDEMLKARHPYHFTLDLAHEGVQTMSAIILTILRKLLMSIH